MANTFFEITPEPPGAAAKIADDYFQVGDHCDDLAPGYRDVIDLLELKEEEHFAKCRGRYVRTGATKASLTKGGGGLRDVDRTRLAFGSTVWYAHYLTKAPKDPANGQVPKSNGKGLSAVLVFSKTTQRKVADMLVGYMAEPFG